MKQHGPWKIVQSTEVYRDPWIDVVRDEVIRPDAQPGTYSVVTLKPGVSVLAVDKSGTAHLTQEFHYAVGRETIEVVSGGIDPGESALDTAKRELQEELGICAQQWTDLGFVDPLTGSLVSPTQLYLAQDLTFGLCSPEGTELIRPLQVPFERATKMVLEGQITHAPSCVAIMKTHLLQLKS